MTQHLLFPTVIEEYQFDLSDLTSINTLINSISTTPHTLVAGAQSSYQEHNDILASIAVQPLRNKLQECIDHYTESIGLDPVKISNSWFNRLGRGHYVERHRHEISVVSGALYLDVDPGSVGLIFHSPLAQLRMFERQIEDCALLMNWVEMPCRTGLLVLFPSWLEHGTRQNATDNRVTLSFNTLYKNNTPSKKR